MSIFNFCGKDLDECTKINGLCGSYFYKFKLSGFFDKDDIGYYVLCNYRNHHVDEEGTTILTRRNALQFRIIEKDDLYYLRIDCSLPNLLIYYKDGDEKGVRELGNCYILSQPFDFAKVNLKLHRNEFTIKDYIIDGIESCVCYLDSEKSLINYHEKCRRDLGISCKNDIKGQFSSFKMILEYKWSSISEFRDIYLYYDNTELDAIDLSYCDNITFKFVPKETNGGHF